VFDVFGPQEHFGKLLLTGSLPKEAGFVTMPAFDTYRLKEFFFNFPDFVINIFLARYAVIYRRAPDEKFAYAAKTAFFLRWLLFMCSNFGLSVRARRSGDKMLENSP